MRDGRQRGGANLRVTSDDAEAVPQWDAFVGAQPAADLAQTAMWALTKRALGQRTRLTTATDTDGSIIAGALVVTSRVMPGAHVGYVARGPVVDVASPFDRKLVLGEIVHRLIEDARSQRCRILVVQPPENLPEATDLLLRRGFRSGAPAVAPEATVRLDLTRTDDELLAAMSSMRRRNVRKVMRTTLDIDESDDVTLFHRLHQASASRQQFEPRSLEYLRAQWAALRPSGAVSILVARVDGVPVAGIWVTSFAGTVTYRLPGWDAAAGGGANVNEALHWTVVQRFRAAGCRTYDLGGFDRASAESILCGDDPGDAFRGTPAYFKLGFDRVPVLLPRALWLLPGRVVGVAGSPLVGRFLQTERGRRLAGRFRNG